MFQVIEDFLDSLLPSILSIDWMFIHFLIAAPLIIILVNFLNGGCDVAESAGMYNKAKDGKEEEDSDEDENEKNNKKSITSSIFDNPRITVALMMLAFFWQIHAVWFVAIRYLRMGLETTTSDTTSTGSAALNSAKASLFSTAPISSIKPSTSFSDAIKTYILHHSAALFTQLLRNVVQYVFIVHALCSLGYLLCCIVVWKRAAEERFKYREITTHKEYMRHFFSNGGKEKEAEGYLNPKTDNTRISFCRRCCTPLVGRDHHCRWLAVCIGATSRYPYVLSLIFGVIFSACDVIMGAICVPILNNAVEKDPSIVMERYYIMIGYLFSIAACVFLIWQSGVQLNLLMTGQTKLGRKGRREAFLMEQHNKQELKEIKKNQ